MKRALHRLRRLHWRSVWRRTIEVCFPATAWRPWALLIAPLTVPFAFVVLARRSYLVDVFIEQMEEAVALGRRLTEMKRK